MNDKELKDIGEQVGKHKRPNRSADLQVQTDPGDNTRYINNALVIASLPPINLDNPKEIDERTYEYFRLCAENDMKPSVAGLALAYGVERGTVWRWSKGIDRGKNSDVRDSVKKAYQMLNILMEDYMQNGKINPVSGIFLMKNNFGYTDKQEVVVTPNNPLGEERSTEEIEQRYLESVPEEDLTERKPKI